MLIPFELPTAVEPTLSPGLAQINGAAQRGTRTAHLSERVDSDLSDLGLG